MKRSSETSEAISYAVCNGIVVKSNKSLTHAPMTLHPTPLDRACYTEATRLAVALNEMLHAIASDTEYLRSTLNETATVDPFTARLLKLLPDRVKGPVLSIVRNDYFVQMIEQPRLRMVEMNTIAASFGVLGAKICAMHRYLTRGIALHRDMPQNYALEGLTNAIAVAHRAFRYAHGPRQGGTRLVVVMVVQPGESNSFDQDGLRFALWERHSVEMVRMSLREIYRSGKIDTATGLLSIESGADMEERVASVVYFRAGYTPEDYATEEEWNARAIIEQSVAAKCPSIAMQLAGTKKIQQMLERSGGVERFVKNGDDVAAIRKTFVRQWSLDCCEDGMDIIETAIARPQDFVLKPQREGGGNNLYGEQLGEMLAKCSVDERKAFVLMERITPIVTRNIIIRNEIARQVDVVSEFGVYGVYVETEKGKVLLNENAGTLLRSKMATQDDGGVAAGVAVLDSPCFRD